MITQTQRIISDYESGLSSYQVAERFNMKPNSIRVLLRNHGKMRPSLGLDIQEEVACFYEKNGLEAVRQKGDAKFDLLVDKLKINVKSASLRKDRPGYTFEIRNKEGSHTPSNCDYLALVFKDTRDIFLLDSKSVKTDRTIYIPKSLETKYPVIKIGNLATMEGGDTHRLG